MKLVTTNPATSHAPSNIETFVVSGAQFSFLGELAQQINPDMPMQFAGAHVIRTLLERFEDAGIDLTDGTSEKEITRLAANGLNSGR